MSESYTFYNPYHFVPFSNNTSSQKNTTPYEAIKNGRDDFVRHDKWHPEAKSGELTCSITLLSPTIIGTKQDSDSGSEPTETEIKQYHSPVTNQPAIPASSLKGMITSLAEALSNSALRVLDDNTYTVRDDVSESINNIGVIQKKAKQTDDGYDWEIVPLCIPPAQKNRQNQKTTSHRSANNKKAFSIKRNERIFGTPLSQLNSFHLKDNPAYYYLKQETNSRDTKKKINTFLTEADFERKNKEDSTFAQDDYTRGVFYILEISKADTPEGKKSDYFVPFPKGPLNEIGSLAIPETVIENFHTIVANRVKQLTEKEKGKYPILPTGYRQKDDDKNTNQIYRELQDGDLIRFELDKNGQVCRLSYSSIWRSLTKHSTFERFAKVQDNLTPWGSNVRTELTPAEKLFGVVESGKHIDEAQTRNLAGRVRFTDATKNATESNSSSKVDVADKDIVLKKLASPKPPSPAFYFPEGKQRKSQFAKQEDANPTGRLKYYLPHKNIPSQDNERKAHWETTLDKHSEDYIENKHLHTKAKPMNEGQTFHFTVRFENLSDAELGLLLCTLKPSQHFVHRIGFGKPLGLGQVNVEVEEVKLINRAQRYKTFDAKQTQRFEIIWSADTKLNNKLPLFLGRGGLVDKSILAGLQFLGDPQNQQENTPVSYPFSRNTESSSQDPYSEKELFKWFSDNYKDSKYEYQTIDTAFSKNSQAIKPGYANWLDAETLSDQSNGATLSPLKATHIAKTKKKQK